MEDYNIKMDDLLNEYNLYKSLDLRTVYDVIREIIEKKIDKNKKYILITDPICDYFFSKKSDDDYIIKRYFVFNGKVESIQENEEKLDGVIICTYVNYIDNIISIKNNFKNSEIIDILESAPKEFIKNNYHFNASYILKKISGLTEKCNKLFNFRKYVESKKSQNFIKKGANPLTIIWGAGVHTECLLNNTNVINQLDVKYIVDSNIKLVGKSIQGIEVIHKETMKNVEFNTILISSAAYKDEIKKEINNLFNNDKCIIDIYENGDIWGKLFSSKMEKNEEKEEDEYYELIKLYLSIRDFYSAEKWIDKYISEKLENYEKLEAFLKRLNIILEDIRDKINNGNHTNVQFIMVDALDKQGTDDYMPFLKRLGENNIVFENAFSPSVYTTESHLCIFSQQYLFENNNFIRRTLKEEECEFVNKLKEKGYSLAANNPCKVITELFEKRISDQEVLETSRRPMSLMIWDNLCYQLANPDKKVFLYTRFMEKHDFGFKEIYGYIDDQFKYYSKFLKNDYIIITADHGYYGDERSYHIPLIIITPDNQQLNIDSVFSTKDIGKVIIDLIEKKSLSNIDNEYIMVERSPIYNERTKRVYMSNNTPNLLQAFKIIVTKEERYIVREDGTEEYYNISKKGNDLICCQSAQDKIDKLRLIHKKYGFPKFEKIDYLLYKE